MSTKNKIKHKQTRKNLNNNNRNNIVKIFLEMLNCVKLYHWNTKSYSQHIATDNLYDDLNKYIDEFVEIMLGKTKQRISSIHLKSCNCTSKNKFLKEIKAFKMYLINLNKFLNPICDTNLINIRDELLGTLDKLLYLFELK